MEIESSSQRKEMLLFLTTNMAAVTSRTNQQYITWAFPLFVSLRKEKLQSLSNCSLFNFRLPRPLKKRAELRWSCWECWQGKA